MGEATKKCIVTREKFQETVSVAFSALHNNQDFSDVTLVCEDNQQIEAHKVVLSASSLLLKRMLLGVQHSHPLVYFWDIRERDMVKIVDFIYNGQVEVYHSDLNEFLNIANRLGIEGVCDNNPIIEENLLPGLNLIKTKEEIFETDSFQSEDEHHKEPLNQVQFLDPLEPQGLVGRLLKRNFKSTANECSFKCNYCPIIVWYDGSNPTGIMQHLRGYHNKTKEEVFENDNIQNMGFEAAVETRKHYLSSSNIQMEGIETSNKRPNNVNSMSLEDDNKYKTEPLTQVHSLLSLEPQGLVGQLLLKYFKATPTEFSFQCNYCPTILRYDGSNPTGIKRHLKKFHEEEYLLFENNKTKEEAKRQFVVPSEPQGLVGRLLMKHFRSTAITGSYKCIYCPKMLRFDGSNPTGIERHLKMQHINEYLAFEEEKNEQKARTKAKNEKKAKAKVMQREEEISKQILDHRFS